MCRMMTSSNNNGDRIFIYVLPGSQYCAKVLAALDSAVIAYDVVVVSFDVKKRQEELPSGGRKVPEMRVVTTATTTTDNHHEDVIHIVQDSESILHWFDDNRGTKFFDGSDASSMLSTRASDEVLAGSALYYNWVDDEGYSLSIRRSIKDQSLPRWLPFRGVVTDLALKSERARFRQEVQKLLNVDTDLLKKEPFIQKMLIDELKFFQSYLKSSEQPYLLGEAPTAADFSVYAQVERLVGDTGDARLFCSFPLLLDNKELARLWQWHDHMRQRHPIVFNKGKKELPPKTPVAVSVGKKKVCNIEQCKRPIKETL